MKNLLLLAAFAFIMFAVAAGASWYVQQQSAGPEAENPSAPENNATRQPDVLAPHVDSSMSGQLADRSPAASQASSLPVAVPPRPMSIEELMRYGLGLNQRDAALKQREEGLQAQDVQIKLALADLQGEQQAIDGLRAQVQSQLEAADKLLGQLDAVRTELKQSRQQTEQDLQSARDAQIEIETQQRENIKQTATWLQAMDPERAADVLREMANDGRLEHGVKLLAQLEEREVAKILSALEDPKLVDQFIARFQDLKRPPAKTSTRK
ncbi:MAG: hypothetical protein ACK5Q5_09480 [Planctomycetaceae bacterium]